MQPAAFVYIKKNINERIKSEISYREGGFSHVEKKVVGFISIKTPSTFPGRRRERNISNPVFSPSGNPGGLLFKISFAYLHRPQVKIKGFVPSPSHHPTCFKRLSGEMQDGSKMGSNDTYVLTNYITVSLLFLF
jgi:hypothetical protein